MTVNDALAALALTLFGVVIVGVVLVVCPIGAHFAWNVAYWAWRLV